MSTKIQSLVPTKGTPLYTVTGDSYTNLRDTYDDTKINAVVLLTDGKNEDPRNNDVDRLLATLRAGSEGQSNRPVRIFPIAYGKDADLATLKRIAEATNAAAYDASNPTTTPTEITFIPWARIILRTSPTCAPNASRIPSSCVRCVTV